MTVFRCPSCGVIMSTLLPFVTHKATCTLEGMSQKEAEKEMDLLLYGNSYTDKETGERIDPSTVEHTPAGVRVDGKLLKRVEAHNDPRYCQECGMIGTEAHPVIMHPTAWAHETREVCEALRADAELARLKNIETWINSMLADGSDCPFCDFQQLQTDGHRDFCPMAFVPATVPSRLAERTVKED